MKTERIESLCVGDSNDQEPAESGRPNVQSQVRSIDRDADAALRIGDSLRYMARNLDKPLQVSTLAALAKTSPSYFFALFKRYTGKAPIEYFICLRMQHARKLLEETSLNVKEVAGTLGYDDQFYFSRLFKSVNGVAPSEYRALVLDARQTEQTRLPECGPDRVRRPQNPNVNSLETCSECVNAIG